VPVAADIGVTRRGFITAVVFELLGENTEPPRRNRAGKPADELEAVLALKVGLELIGKALN
jgi:hypothetical protein